MRRLVFTVAMWVFSRLVPRAEREPLVGDLAEEYARRATASPSAAADWCLRQICASIPPLLWISLARATWPSTIGVALAAYVAVGVAQVVIVWAIPSSSAPIYHALGLIITFPLVVLIGYIAAALRRQAAIVLAAMMLLAMTAMTAWTDENAPLWYVVAYFLVGPTAAFVGSALRSRRPARS